MCTHSRRAFARFHPGKATETLCKWVFAGRTFVDNQERERERRDGPGGRGKGVKERKIGSGGILGGVEAGRISLLRLLPPRDRPEEPRIIFTEIKSKIRLALKCALDRACPNRRWLERERSRSSYPGATRRITEERPRGSDEDARERTEDERNRGR